MCVMLAWLLRWKSWGAYMFVPVVLLPALAGHFLAARMDHLVQADVSAIGYVLTVCCQNLGDPVDRG
jgi:hypothetical protein